jgi:hypothetical protein
MLDEVQSYLEDQRKGLQLAFLYAIINLEFLNPRDSTNSSQDAPLKLKAKNLHLCLFPGRGESQLFSLSQRCPQIKTLESFQFTGGENKFQRKSHL